ncbi:putative effector protein [Ceratobasidium theobromae]|uniref:Putative effector protein n=1 Tax=Ceratobasidium theobromae TaxID=1582974 RepID=A0A5N5QC63_9AGAM|nr:putative effector protein [Ceratobasidium theobromae]
MLRIAALLLAASTLCLAITTPRPTVQPVQEEQAKLLKSNAYGSANGNSFDDAVSIQVPLAGTTGTSTNGPKLLSLTLRGGKRLDGISFGLTSGETFNHGGSGGVPRSITLDYNEYIKSVKLCWGKKGKKSRIFYALATTSTERTIEAGKTTGNCEDVATPDGYTVVGGYGRSGDEIDQLGFVYAPLPKLQ